MLDAAVRLVLCALPLALSAGIPVVVEWEDSIDSQAENKQARDLSLSEVSSILFASPATPMGGGLVDHLEATSLTVGQILARLFRRIERPFSILRLPPTSIPSRPSSVNRRLGGHHEYCYSLPKTTRTVTSSAVETHQLASSACSPLRPSSAPGAVNQRRHRSAWAGLHGVYPAWGYSATVRVGG
ncbi:predicted protein [Plenodomus lingam JN3]|uniref:Predicted protein n=1 Tax=Leptosphaeria maculans (strain JN3 / isolate v23.1.3 / race Av1-4-5-6-7-8) TaxID=985895 RepID=E4ZN55_LEPMJ|nr:predicted protein [Plenodomus lingam JN3]CBX92658.1 predicted protein [Plenodomus lingam JN3]